MGRILLWLQKKDHRNPIIDGMYFDQSTVSQEVKLNFLIKSVSRVVCVYVQVCVAVSAAL